MNNYETPERLPLFSVVITVLNEAKHISRTVESVLNLDYPDYEIIIVDEGSGDETVEIIKRYPSIRLIESKGYNISRGRNIGIKRAKGEIIAITDGDMIVEKDWLRHLARHYKDEHIGGVGGPIYLYPEKTIFQKAIGILPQPGCRYRQDRITSRDPFLISTGNASYRKDLLEKIGGFDENIWVGEDPELNMRVLKSGKSLKFTPRAVTYHFPRETITGYYHQYYNYGFGRALIHKKDIDIFKSRLRNAIPPLAVSFFVMTFLASLVYPPLFSITLLALLFYFLSILGYTVFFCRFNETKKWAPSIWAAASIIYGIRIFVTGAGYIMGLLNLAATPRVHKKNRIKACY